MKLILLVLLSFNIFAEEEIRWDDQIVPLPHHSYYQSRYEDIRREVGFRFTKYFNNYQFAPWKSGKLEKEIREEFLKLSEKRGQIWFDVTGEEIERNWREDFRPNLELVREDVVRNPNCIAFDYNKVNSYYNGSIIEYNDLKFLALEGPLSKSVNRFFFTLLDTNAPLLVCLTPEIENNRERCAPYWKGRLDGNKLSIPRHPQVINNVKQIYYLFSDEWIENLGNTELLLSLVLKAKSLYDPSQGPLAVHCSGGVGRTGSFIAAYCLIHEIDAQIASGVPIEKLKLSVEQVVATLSLQRYHMVARASQYLSLYQLVQLYLGSLSYDKKY